MVKRRQTKAMDIRNQQYREFLKAFRDRNVIKLKEWYDKGFRLPNKIFLNQLEKDLNAVLDPNPDLNKEIPTLFFHSYLFLDPENINVKDNGHTLLDAVVQMFTDAVDIEPTENKKKNMLYYYLFFINNLVQMGAKMSMKVIIPQTIDMNETLQKIITMLTPIESPYPSSEED